MDKLNFIYDSTLLEIIFGPENDWALIENGILKGYMMDKMNGRLMNKPST